MPRRPAEPPSPAAGPQRLQTLSCSDCGRSITTRATVEPAGWPLHRCRAGALATFTDARSTLPADVRLPS